MPYERLFVRKPWHTSLILTDTVGDQIGLVAVEGRAAGHRFDGRGYWDEELSWWHQGIAEVRV